MQKFFLTLNLENSDQANIIVQRGAHKDLLGLRLVLCVRRKLFDTTDPIMFNGKHIRSSGWPWLSSYISAGDNSCRDRPSMWLGIVYIRRYTNEEEFGLVAVGFQTGLIKR